MHTPPTRSVRHAERGAATLIVVLGLFLALLLVAISVNRNLVFEQRSAANQTRSTQAFEAAEAGLEWAQARLNSNARLGPDCEPSADAAAQSFRERFLAHHAADASFTPATGLQGGVAVPRQAACVRGEAGWACHCPLNGTPVLTAPAGTAPAFVLQFQSAAQPGLVRLLATGCTRWSNDCAADAVANREATARVEVLLGLVPGIKTAPAAALTVRGGVDVDAAAIVVSNTNAAAGGIALHAGGAVNASAARFGGPAGGVADAAVVTNDSALAALSGSDFFASVFGMRAPDWQQQSVVTALHCDGSCGAALLNAIGPGSVNPLIHIDGDLQLDGPLVLGTPQRPVVIVVDGTAQLRGAVTLHGLLYSRTLRWDDSTGAGALLRGAALSEGGYSGNGAPTIVHDAAVLALLKGNSGSFTRVNGSWRDF
jgi:Tfp pilus assembly protein PilX